MYRALLWSGGTDHVDELFHDVLRAPFFVRTVLAVEFRAHAEHLAQRFHASARGLEALGEALQQADIVLTCTAGETPILESADFAEATRARHGRPVFVIDLGVPRNVNPAVTGRAVAFIEPVREGGVY